MAILLLLLVVVLVGGIYVLYKKVLSLEAQRRPPTNGAFFEVGAVELETTSLGQPAKRATYHNIPRPPPSRLASPRAQV